MRDEDGVLVPVTPAEAAEMAEMEESVGQSGMRDEKEDGEKERKEKMKPRNRTGIRAWFQRLIQSFDFAEIQRVRSFMVSFRSTPIREHDYLCSAFLKSI